MRAKQAAQTRQSIVEAALRHFAERGWAGTVLPMVANDAGVSVDTIFGTFGTKSALLLEAIEIAIVGDAGEAAMADRDDFARLGQGRRAERLRAGVRYTITVEYYDHTGSASARLRWSYPNQATQVIPASRLFQ